MPVATNGKRAPSTCICGRCSRVRPCDTKQRCLVCKWTRARIVRLRRRLGLTQDHFAFQLGVGTATVTRWESPNKLVSLYGPNLRKLEQLEQRLEQASATPV